MTYLKRYVFEKNVSVSLSVLNIITWINELKALIKHISWEWNCQLDGRKCNSNQTWNNNKCWCECKIHHTYEKYHIWNPDECSCDTGIYLGSIVVDLVITCDEIIDAKETKIVATTSSMYYHFMLEMTN